MSTAPAEAGFELTLPDENEATFFPWSIGMSSSKDMKLIDRCTQMPLDEFAEAFEDPTQRGRGPIMLAMMALSIKAKYPEWSVERIMRVVDDLEMPAVAFIKGDDGVEDTETDPLSESETDAVDAPSFGSRSDDSSSSALPTSSTTSKPSGPSAETQD